MKKTLLLFSMLAILINAFAQKNKALSFKMNGTINADTGTIHLYFYSDYILDTIAELTTQVKNHNFSFQGYIPSPQGVFIIYDNRYMSSDFIIDKDIQTISINIDSSRKMPSIQNKIMNHEYDDFHEAFSRYEANRNKFNKRYDSLRMVYHNQLPDSTKLSFAKEDDKLYRESNETLLHYVLGHKNSYIAFWRLIRLTSWGYEPIFDSIYNAFADELKNTYSGKILNKKLQQGSKLSVGKKFPYLNAINTNSNSFSVDIFLKSSFTLVDFWYAHCGPCRAQFSSLKKLYSNYYNKGFEIVGISTDKTTDKKDWENAIVKEQLNWLQYWDKDGRATKQLSIYAFPTNFLVDIKGEIIAKNISMEELETFLKQNTN